MPIVTVVAVAVFGFVNLLRCDAVAVPIAVHRSVAVAIAVGHVIAVGRLSVGLRCVGDVADRNVALLVWLGRRLDWTLGRAEQAIVRIMARATSTLPCRAEENLIKDKLVAGKHFSGAGECCCCRMTICVHINVTLACVSKLIGIRSICSRSGLSPGRGSVCFSAIIGDFIVFNPFSAHFRGRGGEQLIKDGMQTFELDCEGRNGRRACSNAD